MTNTVIHVQGYNIAIDPEDFICLTDMAKAAGDLSRAADVIKNWLRKKETVEFLGIWESINNPKFKVVDFDHFRKEAGNQNFTLSVDSWVEKTGAVGIYTKKGKTGGTYAQKDIAFEFGSAISPVFKLYLIKEFQRLKEIESNVNNLEWNVRRVLSKAQWHIQTDAVKDYKIPHLGIPDEKRYIAYAEEGDILNLVMFGFTAKEWREANPKLAIKNNVRDFASVNQLAIMATLEGINAEMLKENMDYKTRFQKLKEISTHQMATLERINIEKSYKKTLEGGFKPVFKTEKNPKGMFPESPQGIK